MTSKPSGDKAPVKAASARGRTVVAKPLDGSTASSRAKLKSHPSATTAKTLLPEKKVPQKISPNASSNSVASLKTSERATTSGKTPTSRIPSTGDAKSRADVKKSIPSSVKPGAPTSKPESVSTSLPPSISSDSATTTASAKSSVPPPSQAPAPPALTEEASTRTSDPLQVAAQVYPWLYMTSTLEACFRTAEEKAMVCLAYFSGYRTEV